MSKKKLIEINKLIIEKNKEIDELMSYIEYLKFSVLEKKLDELDSLIEYEDDLSNELKTRNKQKIIWGDN